MPEGDFSNGPVPCDFAVVGEAPGSTEMTRRQYFVGPSGEILWPLVKHFTGLDRRDIYVTNVVPHLLDDSKPGSEKVEPEELEQCKIELWKRLDVVRPTRILAVGSIAARVLLGDRFTRMDVDNGMGMLWHGSTVVPCWHPAAALHETGEKDPLVWTADAIKHWVKNSRYKKCLSIPDPTHDYYGGLLPDIVLGIDTEGTPDDPICLTWASDTARGIVYPKDVPAFWTAFHSAGGTAVYHNAPWDWAVLEAMGVRAPWHIPFYDTMELAYLKQHLPKGLKDLGRRFFGLDMKTWEETVSPYYDAHVRDVAQAIVEGGTTVITHSPKTGRLLKKPKQTLTPEAKKLSRAIDKPKRLQELLDFEEPSLRYVPEDVLVEYATLDPFVTLNLLEELRCPES